MTEEKPPEPKKPKKKTRVEKLHDESVEKLGKGTRKEWPGRKPSEGFQKPKRDPK